MRVNFYATLRELAGGKTVVVDPATPVTARTALKAVTDIRPKLAEKVWDAAGQLTDYIHVFVNGRQSEYLPQGLDTPITEQDALDIFPPVGGGCAN